MNCCRSIFCSRGDSALCASPRHRRSEMGYLDVRITIEQGVYRHHHCLGASQQSDAGGQRQDRHRPHLGLCARRQAFWRAGAAGRRVPLLARSGRRPSPGAPGRLQRKLQADAYRGYGKLYQLGRRPGPILEAACWVRARRPFFAMADLAENARRKAQGRR
jgi:hypothetical protein